MLTLSKVVVQVGNRADAARAGDYRLELEAAPEAFARTDYQLAADGLEPVQERCSSLWLGSDEALAQFGVRRGQAIDRDDLIAVLQGQHVETGEQLRRPGALKREVSRDERGVVPADEEGRPVVERVTGVAHVEMTLSVPKSGSVLWAMADEQDRRRIEDGLLEAAERTVEYMAQNKAVVHRRGKDGVRVREPAAGTAIASSLHVTARRARGDPGAGSAAACAQPGGRRDEGGQSSGGGGLVGMVSPRRRSGGRRAVSRPGWRRTRSGGLGDPVGHGRSGALLRGGGCAGGAM